MKAAFLRNINNFNLKIKNVWTLVVLILLLIFIFESNNFNSILTFAINALMGTVLFILFAVSLVAYLKATGAESLVSKAFKGKEVRTIFIATLVGGFAPFCSCEVIPFIASMLALGVPLSAVMAFWLSSPLIDPPALLITASALGWDYAIAKTISALTIGLIGGWVGCQTAGITTASFLYGIKYEFNSFYVTYCLIKITVFAFIISSVSSYFGYYTNGGALDVGRSSTKAVVYSSIIVLIFNFLLTDLLLA